MHFKDAPLALCYVANSAYLPHFAASLYSYLHHHPEKIDVFLFSDDANTRMIESIQSAIKRVNADASINLIKLQASDFDSFTGFWQQHGRQVFYRFKIPDLLPKQFKYALYIDVDTIFCSALNLGQWQNIDSPLFAVTDTISHILAPKRNLDTYFNSGFLLIDVKRWVEENVTEALFTLEPPLRRFADQDILNHYFKNAWLALPAIYNFPASSLKLTSRGYRTPNGEKPVLIHFNGGIKPWKYWQSGSFLYWKYIIKTPLRAYVRKLPISILRSIMRVIKNQLS